MEPEAPDARLETLERAIEADPDNIEQLRLWANLARRTQHRIAGKTIDAWIAALAGPGWNKQYEASERIRSLGPRMLVPLMDALGHESLEVRKFAAETLGRLGAPGREAIPALQAALSSSDACLVERCCESLLRLKDRSTALHVGLLRLISSPDGALVRRAFRLLRPARGRGGGLSIAPEDFSPANTSGDALAMLRELDPELARQVERQHAEQILTRLEHEAPSRNLDTSRLTARALPEAGARLAALVRALPPDSPGFALLGRALTGSAWRDPALDAALDEAGARHPDARSVQVLARCIQADWEFLASAFTERRAEFESALGELAAGAALAPLPREGPVREALWRVASRGQPTGPIPEQRIARVRRWLGVQLPADYGDARALLRRRLLDAGPRP